jgi:hypothetical protein
LICGEAKPAAVHALNDEIRNMDNAPAAFIPKWLFTLPHPHEVGLVIGVKARFVVENAVMSLFTGRHIFGWNRLHVVAVIFMTEPFAQ